MGVNTEKLPKHFARCYFKAEDKTAFLNKTTFVAQYDYPGLKGEGAKARLSSSPIVKPAKGAPHMFVVEPQPQDMVEGWEQCIAITPGKKVDWEHPDILYRRLADNALQMADPRPVAVEKDLPEGWTEEVDSEGDTFFYDHNNTLATYDDPRLVAEPQQSVQLAAIVSARFKRKRKGSRFLVPSNEAPKKAWVIGPCDKTAFDEIDNNLTTIEEIPACVRNKRHNRYLDILPNPKTAIKLPIVQNDPESEYVNANYVQGPNGDPKFYVAAMGPLPTTIAQFWRMIWETNTAAIIMVTGLVEKGRTKCERYWPAEVDNTTTMQFGDISVVCQNEAAAKGYHYTLLKVTRGHETRKIGHFWYNTWPDHGVPRDDNNELFTDSVLGLMHTVHKFCSKSKNRPITIHCSAGIGRTGTIIAIDFCRTSLKEAGKADPLKVIEKIRNDRCALVQHPIQFEFVHSACVRYAELHKHKFIIQEDTVDEEEETEFKFVRKMTVADRKKAMSSEKEAAKKRREENSHHPTLMTNAQVHGELRRRHRGPRSDDEIDEAWKIIDLDNCGHITLREAAMRGIPQSVFKQMDSDNNGFLTMEEYKAFFKKMRTSQ
eukprot:m.138003 g.138003  ORF g.138003 m.138003 type:complete len:601 (-) comp12910_c0_seq1:117-1919(-)